MIIIDTAPIISLFDAGQKYHQQCLKTYKDTKQPLLTTWCCFTEAMYFLYRLRGWQGQKTLWMFVENNALYLRQTTQVEQERMQKLMEQYKDTPMDLADASLVATAESTNITTIFTLDSDFFVYRLQDGRAFTVIPNINVYKAD